MRLTRETCCGPCAAMIAPRGRVGAWAAVVIVSLVAVALAATAPSADAAKRGPAVTLEATLAGERCQLLAAIRRAPRRTSIQFERRARKRWVMFAGRRVRKGRSRVQQPCAKRKGARVRARLMQRTRRGQRMVARSRPLRQPHADPERPPDDLPPIAQVRLSDPAPRTNDTLTAAAFDVQRDAGDPVSFTYVWKVDGTVVRETATSSTEDSLDLSQPGNGDRGQRVSVELTPSVGDLSGPTVSADVVIVNTPPAAEVDVSPSTPSRNGIVTANVTANDPDGDDLTFTYVWKLNGEIVQTVANTDSESDTLDLGSLAAAPGDQVTVEVTPHDGFVAGSAVSADVVIVNTPPTAEVILTPEIPTTVGIVTANVTANDPDGDDLTFTYVWKLNGEIVQTVANTDSESDTLDLGSLATAPGDQVTVEVTPHDGFVAGAPASATVTVAS